MRRLANNSRSALKMSGRVIYAALLFLNISAVAAPEPKAPQRQEGIEKPPMTIKDALTRYTDELMALPGVVGAGQGLCEGTPCIKVYVVKKTPQLEKQIHKTLRGFSYQIQESGKIRPRLN